MCSSAVTSVHASSRILLRITLERIQVKTETEIGDEQVGFRQGRGKRSNLYVLCGLQGVRLYLSR